MIPKPAPPSQAEAPTTQVRAYRPRRLANPRLAPSAGPVAAGPRAGAGGTGSQGLAAPPALGAPDILFVNRGGLVLSDVDIILIFWGSAWAATPTPTSAEITYAVETILASSYTSGLTQYGNIGPGRLRGRLLVTSSDPPNPFSDSDIAGLVHKLFEAGELVEPDDDPQALYVVILPPGVSFSNPNVIGEHSFFLYLDLTDPQLPPDFDLANAHYAWVSNDGTLDSVTTIFSHELAEACTDPEGTAIQGLPGTCAQDGWCEIGDVCWTTGVVDGVRVQSYWSYNDRACIIPGATPDAEVPASAPIDPTHSGGRTREVAISSATSSPTSGAGASIATPASPPPNGQVAAPADTGEKEGPTSTQPLPRTDAAPREATPSAAEPAMAAELQPVGHAGSPAAMLASLSPGIPILAAVATVCAYVSGIPGVMVGLSAPATAILSGSLLALVVWLVLAIIASRFASAPLANPEEYGQIRMRVHHIKTRLLEPAPPGLPPVEMLARQIAIQEASDMVDLVEDELSTAGLRWVLAVGYINAWATLHRGEEALLLADRVDALVGEGAYDEARLEGSDIAHADELLAKLRHAVSVLDAKARKLYLGGTDDLTAADLDGTSPLAARQVLRKIRRIINEFRDDLWGGLVRARNEFLKTHFVTGAGAYFLLVLVLLRGIEATIVIAAGAFFTFGALIGLLARIRDEGKTDKAIEDFGLSTARLAAAPLYAGLAALFGVLLVGLTHISIGPISLGPAPPPGAGVPTLQQIFSLRSNPIGFLAAGLFGLTPSLLFDYLQTETDAFRKSIASSQPSGASPPPAQK